MLKIYVNLWFFALICKSVILQHNMAEMRLSEKPWFSGIIILKFEVHVHHLKCVNFVSDSVLRSQKSDTWYITFLCTNFREITYIKSTLKALYFAHCIAPQLWLRLQPYYSLFQPRSISSSINKVFQNLLPGLYAADCLQNIEVHM